MMNRKSCLMLAYAFVFVLSVASTVQAMSLTINPSKIRLSISPGKSYSGTIQLENSSDQEVSVKAYLEDWQYSSSQDGTKTFKPAGTLPLSCANWINFAPSEFTIPAFGKQLIGYSLKVPDEAQGGHYAVMFFETAMGEQPAAGTTKEEGVSVTVFGRIGTLFYVETEGATTKDIKLSDFSIKRANNSAPMELSLAIENTGNVDVTCGGTYHIMDNEGLIYARGEFGDVFTFPGNSATLMATWKEPIKKGSYDLVLTLDLGKAADELGVSRGPTFVKEAAVGIGSESEVVSFSELQ